MYVGESGLHVFCCVTLSHEHGYTAESLSGKTYNLHILLPFIIVMFLFLFRFNIIQISKTEMLRQGMQLFCNCCAKFHLPRVELGGNYLAVARYPESF